MKEKIGTKFMDLAMKGKQLSEKERKMVEYDDDVPDYIRENGYPDDPDHPFYQEHPEKWDPASHPQYWDPDEPRNNGSGKKRATFKDHRDPRSHHNFDRPEGFESPRAKGEKDLDWDKDKNIFFG